MAGHRDRAAPPATLTQDLLWRRDLEVGRRFISTSEFTAWPEDRLDFRHYLGCPSHYCSEQGPDACRQSHRECTPESDAYCAHRDTRAARARRQRTQKREEQQRSCRDEDNQTRLWDEGSG